jgi:diaminopimelate epimerase
MKLRFTKMHGAGNDFLVFDGIHQHINLTPDQWRSLADRRFGVGADQMLVVERTTTPSVDFRYRIFNADGSEVEQCGNGSRAFVQFVHEKKLTDKTRIRVETMSGIIELNLESNGQITVNMGAPILEPARVPFDTTDLASIAESEATLWPLTVGQSTIQVSAISMGNPHAVQIVADVEQAPVLTEGPVIEHHPRFPKRVNAGFMQIIDPHHIKLRVYERGAGETLACGTGACAAVISGILRGKLISPVTVTARGGELVINWAGTTTNANGTIDATPVFLTGPAVTVFEGEILV